MYNKGEGMCWSMKKYKQLILGIIIGVMIASVVPVGAAIQEYICHKVDYKVVVNGVEYVNEELPVLNYKGSTYAPFRSILEAAGLVVNWNAEYRIAQVNIPKGGLLDMGEKINPVDFEAWLPNDAEFFEYKQFKHAVMYNNEVYICDWDFRTVAGFKRINLEDEDVATFQGIDNPDLIITIDLTNTDSHIYNKSNELYIRAYLIEQYFNHK
jgi:hypothetical protein